MSDAGLFCTNVFDAKPVSLPLIGLPNHRVGLTMICIGSCYLLTAVVIVYWIKRQEFLAKSTCDSSNNHADSVIFPVFVTVLWINSGTFHIAY